MRHGTPLMLLTDLRGECRGRFRRVRGPHHHFPLRRGPDGAGEAPAEGGVRHGRWGWDGESFSSLSWLLVVAVGVFSGRRELAVSSSWFLCLVYYTAVGASKKVAPLIFFGCLIIVAHK